MKTILTYLLAFGLLASCTDKSAEKAPEKKEKESAPSIQLEEDLIEIKGNVYTEYYPGKKAIKFQGEQDNDGFRHGVWLYYSEKGEELSMTNYEHGIKEGHSIVKYPNGAIHYTGAYKNDKPVGIWKTYDVSGKIATTKDYDKTK